MLHIEIKHDSCKNNKWCRLSVSLYDAMADAKYRDKIESIAIAHMNQYAIDNQMNNHCLAIRVVDKNGIVLYYRRSNAQVNHPNPE